MASVIMRAMYGELADITTALRIIKKYCGHMAVTHDVIVRLEREVVPALKASLERVK